MDKMSIFVAILLACLVQPSHGTQADEIKNNKVKVMFYNAVLGHWNTNNMSNIFKETVAATATTVCTANLAGCGLKVAATFVHSLVTVESVERVQEYLAVTYYISFPSGVTLTDPAKTNFLLNKDSAADAVINSIDTLYNRLGYEVVEVDNETFPKKPDWLMNVIMIPITFVVLIIVIVICLICYFYTENQKKVELRKMRKEERKQRHEERKMKREATLLKSKEKKGTKVSPTASTDLLPVPKKTISFEEMKPRARQEPENDLSKDTQPSSSPLPPPPEYYTGRDKRPAQVTNGDGNHDNQQAPSNVIHGYIRNPESNRLPPVDTNTDSDTKNDHQPKRAKRKAKKMNFDNPAYKSDQQGQGSEENESENTSKSVESPDPESMFELANQRRSSDDVKFGALMADDLP